MGHATTRPWRLIRFKEGAASPAHHCASLRNGLMPVFKSHAATSPSHIMGSSITRTPVPAAEQGRHQSRVIDLYGISPLHGSELRASAKGFRGVNAGHVEEAAEYKPLFTPPLVRSRLHTETKLAVWGLIVAAAIFFFTVWTLFSGYKKLIPGSRPSPAVERDISRFHQGGSTPGS